MLWMDRFRAPTAYLRAIGVRLQWHFCVGIAEGQGAAVSNRRRMERVGLDSGLDGRGPAPRFDLLALTSGINLTRVRLQWYLDKPICIRNE